MTRPTPPAAFGPLSPPLTRDPSGKAERVLVGQARTPLGSGSRRCWQRHAGRRIRQMRRRRKGRRGWGPRWRRGGGRWRGSRRRAVATSRASRRAGGSLPSRAPVRFPRSSVMKDTKGGCGRMRLAGARSAGESASGRLLPRRRRGGSGWRRRPERRRATGSTACASPRGGRQRRRRSGAAVARARSRTRAGAPTASPRG